VDHSIDVLAVIEDLSHIFVRAAKRITRPMLGFKSVEAAQCTLAGIELMHMLRKSQRAGETEAGLTAAEQFYALAASSPQGRPSFVPLKNCDRCGTTSTPTPIPKPTISLSGIRIPTPTSTRMHT
jgi:hypothetical protein